MSMSNKLWKKCKISKETYMKGKSMVKTQMSSTYLDMKLNIFDYTKTAHFDRKCK